MGGTEIDKIWEKGGGAQITRWPVGPSGGTYGQEVGSPKILDRNLTKNISSQNYFNRVGTLNLRKTVKISFLPCNSNFYLKPLKLSHSFTNSLCVTFIFHIFRQINYMATSHHFVFWQIPIFFTFEGHSASPTVVRAPKKVPKWPTVIHLKSRLIILDLVKAIFWKKRALNSLKNYICLLDLITRPSISAVVHMTCQQCSCNTYWYRFSNCVRSGRNSNQGPQIWEWPGEHFTTALRILR